MDFVSTSNSNVMEIQTAMMPQMRSLAEMNVSEIKDQPQYVSI